MLSLETRKFLAILLDQYEVMEFGFSKQAAQDKMQQRFNLTKKAAAEYMKKYYTNNRQTK